MEVRMISIGDVIPYARNPRKNQGAVAKVAASLKEFGWRQPIVVDHEMVVIVGHTRLLAAQRMGMTTVPVHVADGLSAAQVKAYRLADNRTGEEAEWDNDLLKIELGDLRDDSFDIALTGFDLAELNKLFGTDGEAADELSGESALGDGLQYQVVVDCRDETDQAAVLERLKDEGRECRPLTL